MLSIGEFSNVCKVSTKTLRYYAEIGLLAPSEINPENGYRYYSTNQLETMLLINRLKEYSFSLDEIKAIIHTEEGMNEALYPALLKKRRELEDKLRSQINRIKQLEEDLMAMKQGKSIMDYTKEINVCLVEVLPMSILSIRKYVQAEDYAQEFNQCYSLLFKKIAQEGLRLASPPMVLYHADEFSVEGLDTEFAIPVTGETVETRCFCPQLCLKTVLKGAYSNLPAVYARHREWIEQEGYEYRDALYEVYVKDPSEIKQEADLITEVYSPIKKLR